MWAGPIDDVNVVTGDQLHVWFYTSGQQLTTMGRSCAVWGCSNTTKNGVSLFQFPKGAKLRNTWTAQVKKTRAMWKGPTANSAVCSEHFSPECFDITSATAKKLGFKMKARLKPDAIPTIFPRPSAPLPKEPRTSRAYEKRECSRVRNGCVLN